MMNILVLLIAVLINVLLISTADPGLLIYYGLTFAIAVILYRYLYPPPERPAADALRECKKAISSLAIFSGLINVLALSGAFFMLEIYDRVLPSKSVPTLLGLALIVIFLYNCQGILEVIRNRILLRIGISIDGSLNEKVYKYIVRTTGDHNQPIRDLDSVRTFLSGQGPIAFFDMPWTPLYIAILFFAHPALGWTALAGAAILIFLTVLTELKTREAVQATMKFASMRQGIIDTSKRNAEVLISMGMMDRVQRLWSDTNDQYIEQHRKVSDVASGIGAISKVIRMILQSAMLAIGAYLVIYQEASGGIIIAGSIITARALAPIDLAIINWKGFITARQAWTRLKTSLNAMPSDTRAVSLPAPKLNLIVENVSGCPPGQTKPFVNNVSFGLKAGQGLGVVGTSASGKTSLARMLVGVWPLTEGRIKIDGASLDQWSSEALGKYVGYLPQDVELLSGSIAENISRFEPKAQTDDILAAATAADIHSLVVSLPYGYDTQIGDYGVRMSSGQKQRIALARALYRNPFLIVLDEPNSNLDAQGEVALSRAIMGVRQRGGIAIVVSHRPSALVAVDHLMVLHDGTVQQFGYRDDLLKLMSKEKKWTIADQSKAT